MQCTKRVLPHSKFNYVKCTRKQKESFVDILPETTNLDAKAAVMEMAQNAVSEMPGTVANAVSEMPGTVANAVSEMPGTVANAVSEMPGTVANAVSEMPGTVANAVSEMPTLAKAAVVGLADGITDSVTDMSKMAKAGVIGLVKSSDSTDMTVPMDETSCNKKNLHITIGVLIMIILVLISYIIYKQMKSN